MFSHVNSVPEPTSSFVIWKCARLVVFGLNNNLLTQLSVPAFCRWNNYRHWWNHGGEGEAVRFVRESGLFVP